MELKTLTEKCDMLSQLRSQRDETKSKLDEARQDFEKSLAPMELTVYEVNLKIKDLQDEILTELKSVGAKTWKTESGARVTRGESVTYKITNPELFLKSLNKLKIKEPVYKIALTENFKQYKDEKNIKGLTPQVKEFISFRQDK